MGKSLHQLLVPFLLAVVLCIIVLFSAKKLFNNDIFVNTNRASVIKEMQKLNRLETAAYTIEKIIDAGTHGSVFEQWLYGDNILLIAHGQVIAGIDLSKLSDRDITITAKNIAVQLPAAEIFVTRLDNTQTRVYDRKLGILTKGAKDLEAEARQSAEAAITKSACAAGMLKTASDNGQKQIEILLHTLGFDKVTVTTRSVQC